MSPLSNEELKKATFNLCKQIAASRELVAACLYGPQVCGYGQKEGDVNVLLVVSGFSPTLKSYRKSLNGIHVLVLVVNRGAFEKDVAAGWLGEFAAEKVMVPYEPLFNEEYLSRQETLLKRRIVWELLESIVLGFPESSHELIIMPEYFLYETIMQRSKLFPPVTFRFLNMLRNDVKEKNVKVMMRSFSEALRELAKEKWIKLSDDHVKITRKFIYAIKRKKVRVPSFLRSIQRAAFFHVFSVLPKMMSPLQREEEIFMKTHR
jgi:hypothetical protein